MKKIILILVLVVAFSTQAQQKKYKRNKVKFTTEQRAEIAVKRMTLALDLSESQQNKVRPLFLAQAKKRKEAMEARKAAKKAQKKPTADEIYNMKIERLDNMIAMKNSMKEILNKDQFEKFQKMNHKRKAMAKKKMRQKKMMSMEKRKENHKKKEQEG